MQKHVNLVDLVKRLAKFGFDAAETSLWKFGRVKIRFVIQNFRGNWKFELWGQLTFSFMASNSSECFR